MRVHSGFTGDPKHRPFALPVARAPRVRQASSLGSERAFGREMGQCPTPHQCQDPAPVGSAGKKE